MLSTTSSSTLRHLAEAYGWDAHEAELLHDAADAIDQQDPVQAADTLGDLVLNVYDIGRLGRLLEILADLAGNVENDTVAFVHEEAERAMADLVADPTTQRSRGHLGFVGVWEYYQRDRNIGRARRTLPVMPDGYRCGRWEAYYRNHRQAEALVTGALDQLAADEAKHRPVRADGWLDKVDRAQLRGRRCG